MDIPAFSRSGINGTDHKRITKYGTSKYDHFCREAIGHWHGKHNNTESDSRWHSSEGNGKESRDSFSATMVRKGESANEKIEMKSYRSRSRSPAHRFNRASVNDQSGRITTYGCKNDEPHSTGTVPCKFFATGNCRHGIFCQFSHNSWTQDSFGKYKPDDHMQGIDNCVYMSPFRASDFYVSPCYRDENEEFSEQRAMRSSADDNAITENTHRMDSDEQNRNDGRSHLSLTAHSSSGMGVSEWRGTAICGADAGGSITHTENQSPILNGTSRKSDVLDTVKPESAASNQCPMTNEQSSCLTNILTQLLENGKQHSELYAALNALGFMQASVSGSVGPDNPASASKQYDPVTDSLELVNSVISEQQDGIALTSQLLLTGGLGGDGLYGTDCTKTALNVNRLQSSKKALLADCKDVGRSILKVAEMQVENVGGQLANNEGDDKAAELKKNSDGKNLQRSEKAAVSDCENQEHSILKVEVTKKGEDTGKLVNNVRDDKADGIKKDNDRKSLRAFKSSLADFVKELLSPTWKEGQINKEAYKTIVKNVVEKVIASVQSIHMPKTKEKIDNYLSVSKPKILKLLQAYIEEVKEGKQSNIA